jgi:hypothetical protein
MFITDSSQRVLMAPSTHLSPTNTPTTLVPMTGLTNPSGITLDASGNIYVSDLSGTVTKLWVNAGALSFVGKSVGSTLTTNVTNIGNLPLTISKMAFTSGASFSETDNCTGVSIAAGGSCTITVTDTNATGDNSDTSTRDCVSRSTAYWVHQVSLLRPGYALLYAVTVLEPKIRAVLSMSTARIFS